MSETTPQRTPQTFPEEQASLASPIEPGPPEKTGSDLDASKVVQEESSSE